MIRNRITVAITDAKFGNNTKVFEVTSKLRHVVNNYSNVQMNFSPKLGSFGKTEGRFVMIGVKFTHWNTSTANTTAFSKVRNGMVLLTRALLGLCIFHYLLGGGGGGVFEHPPSNSAPTHRRAVRKTAFESSLKNHSETTSVNFKLRSKFRSPEVKRSNLTKMVFSTITSLFLKIEQWFWLYYICLVKERRMMYNLTLKGQGQLLTSGQGQLRSLGDPSRSKYKSFAAPCRDERNETNHTSLSYSDLKLLAKKLLVTSTQDMCSELRQLKFKIQILTMIAMTQC